MRRVGWVTVASSLVLAMAFAGTAVAAQGEPLSKPDYIKAADDICRQGNQLSEEAAATDFAGITANEEPSLERMTTYVGHIEPIVRQEIDSLRALPAPTADKKRLKKIYKLVEKGLDKVVADPGLAVGSDVFAKANKAGRKYGFEVCGSSSG